MVREGCSEEVVLELRPGGWYGTGGGTWKHLTGEEEFKEKEQKVRVLGLGTVALQGQAAEQRGGEEERGALR